MVVAAVTVAAASTAAAAAAAVATSPGLAWWSARTTSSAKCPALGALHAAAKYVFLVAWLWTGGWFGGICLNLMTCNSVVFATLLHFGSSRGMVDAISQFFERIFVGSAHLGSYDDLLAAVG